MNVALIDDDIKFNEIFKQEFREMIDDYSYFNSFNLFVSECENGYKPEVVFLDIEMPEISGIDAAKIINKLYMDCVIVMVSVHDELILESFGKNIIGYLPKKIIGRYKKHIYRRINEEYCQKVDIVINSNKGLIKLSAEEIIYIEIIKRTLHIYTVRGTFTVYNKGINHFYKLLDPSLFIFVNRSTIVNSKYVISLNEKKIYLSGDNGSFEISRGRVKEVKEFLKAY